MKTTKKKVAPAAKKSPAKARAKAKPTTKKSVAKGPTARGKTTATRRTARSKKKATARAGKATAAKKWLAFIEKHGVVLASAKGPVPSLAEQIAGEPIIGSWWSHPKGKEIFEVLLAIDDDADIRSFKLVDGKVTFVHRRVWPALVRLGRDGVLAKERVELFRQEHTQSGEHRNIHVAFPDWVPDDVGTAADRLSADAARAQLGAWV